MLRDVRAAARRGGDEPRLLRVGGARSGASSRSPSTSGSWTRCAWPPERDRTLASGALHDAAEMARHVPTAMVFTSSTGGLSHTKEEDTPEPHLERAIAAYADVARQLIAGEIV